MTFSLGNQGYIQERQMKKTCMECTREEMEAMSPEWIILVVMPEKMKKNKRSTNNKNNSKNRNNDTHIYLDRERFQMRSYV